VSNERNSARPAASRRTSDDRQPQFLLRRSKRRQVGIICDLRRPSDSLNYCTTVCATIDGSVYVGMTSKARSGRVKKEKAASFACANTKGLAKLDEIVPPA